VEKDFWGKNGEGERPTGPVRKPMSKAAKGALGCFGLFVVAIIGFAPDVPTEGNEAAPASAAKAPAEAKASAPAKANPLIKARADWKVLYDRALAIARPCDRANSAAADKLTAVSKGKATVFDAYGLASTAEQACTAAWQEMGDLKAPDTLPGATRDKLGETLERCELSYYSRKESLEILMKFLDGEQRPSIVQEYKDETESAQTGVLLCVAGLIQAGGEVGAEIPKGT